MLPCLFIHVGFLWLNGLTDVRRGRQMVYCILAIGAYWWWWWWWGGGGLDREKDQEIDVSFLLHGGKEHGKCTHQWTTKDEKNTNERFRHLTSLSGKRRETDNNKKKKESEKRTDEKGPTKLDQRIWPTYPFLKFLWSSWVASSRLSSSRLFVVVGLSSFTWQRHKVSKALVCIFLIVCRPFPSSLPRLSTSPAAIRFSF